MDVTDADCKGKVLVVDDEEDLRCAVGLMLEGAGYAVCTACDGREALEAFDREHPDLVVMDVMMPDMDGFAACRAIRERTPDVPLLFLSAKHDISDMEEGFGLGADDYLAKPFRQQELLLRVGALLRRASRPAALEQVVRVDDLEVDYERREVRVAGKAADLTPKEFAIVALLGRNLGQTLSNDDLVVGVWGEEYVGTSVSVPVYIHRLRDKIEPNPAQPRYVKTVVRKGYRLGG